MEQGAGTPTTGGLWFQRVNLRDPRPGRQIERRTVASGLTGRSVRMVSRRIRLPGRRPRCSNDRVELSLEPLSDVLEQAEHAARAGSHPVSRVWPTGFDVLDQTLAGGMRSGRAGAARRPPGPGQDDLGAPGRPQHRPLGPPRRAVLLRARHPDAADPAGRPRGRPARRARPPPTSPGSGPASSPRTAGPARSPTGSRTPRAGSRRSTSSRSTPTGCSCTGPPGPARPWR